jgi:hypothetical protein
LTLKFLEAGPLSAATPRGPGLEVLTMARWNGMRGVRSQLTLVSLALAITGIGSALATPTASASSYTISRYAGIVNNTG